MLGGLKLESQLVEDAGYRPDREHGFARIGVYQRELI
jgi:hypothetical protein